MKIVDSKEIYDIEQRAEAKGVSRLMLMENAGRSIAEALKEEFPACPKETEPSTLKIFCGKGNNGGDGLVAARYLMSRRRPLEVYILAGKEKELSPLAQKNLLRLKRKGLKPVFLSSLSALKKRNSGKGIIVDAIFGTGFKGEVKGLAADVIDFINQSKGNNVIVSIDLPSGLNANTGEKARSCIKADWTWTLGLPKIGLFKCKGEEQAGRLRLIDIGIPSNLYPAEGKVNFIMEKEIMIPLRPAFSHKGTFGHTFILAGSPGLTGAATLASLGALRSGAGLVTLGIPESLNSIMEVKLTEVMTLPLPETRHHCLGLVSYVRIKKFLKKIDALAIGPGISRSSATIKLVRKLVREVKNLPLVIDADGLFALRNNLDLIEKKKKEGVSGGVPLTNIVLTPHPGEMGILLNKNVQDVLEARIEIARGFASYYRVMLVLKGHRTIIASPEGPVWINSTGNPGMASPGTGDVLSGMIASLAGQKFDLLNASKIAVYVHGLAGDFACRFKGEMGITALDLVEEIPYVLRHFNSGKGEV